MFDAIKKKGFQVLTLHHAEAILKHDMTTAAAELESVLMGISVSVEELVRGGGGEGQLTQRMRKALNKLDWMKHEFEVTRHVDGKKLESNTHEIDHVKKFGDWTFALEIEWNNKDPFYDRDLENFKRLHGDGAISMGGIITRGESLHESMRDNIEKFARMNRIGSLKGIEEYYRPTVRQRANIERAVTSKGSFEAGWAHAFVSDKFGEATTHWRKLDDRIHRGVGNPCPLLLIGIPDSIVTF
jgi:hypothetical protein